MPYADDVWTHGASLTLGPFADLAQADRQAIVSLAVRRRFLAGQTVFHKGDRADHIVIVQSGLVAVEAATSDDRRMILALMGAEDVLGEMALAGVPRRTATVIAVQDTEVLMLDAGRLRDLRSAALDVDAAVMGVLADTVRRLTAQVLEATLLSQATRLRLILLRLNRHYQGGRIALTHDQFAEMLGAQRTTVTELLAAEVRKGHIETGRGFVQLLDVAALRTAAH